MTIVTACVKLPQGRQFHIALDPEQYSQRLMCTALDGGLMYEQSTSACIITMLREGDVVVDVGAHVGWFTLLTATMVGNSGRVMAFEPVADNFEHLQANIDRNFFCNVEAVQAAVGARQGSASLFINADNDGGHALWDVGLHPMNELSRAHPQKVDVAVVDLDTTLDAAGLDRIRLIKIDAEGAEIQVLEGARRALAEGRVDFVICELNESALRECGTSSDAMRRMMLSHGYQSFLVGDGWPMPLWLPPETRVSTRFTPNLLFAKPDGLAALYPSVTV